MTSSFKIKSGQSTSKPKSQIPVKKHSVPQHHRDLIYSKLLPFAKSAGIYLIVLPFKDFISENGQQLAIYPPLNYYILLLLKILPVVSLIFFVNTFRKWIPRYRSNATNFIIFGLIFSAIGDIFMDSEMVGQEMGLNEVLRTNKIASELELDAFKLGIIFFALGHCFYILAFGFKFNNIPALGYVVCLLYTVLSCCENFPQQVLKTAVYFYAIIIGVMHWRSFDQIGYTNLTDFATMFNNFDILQFSAVWGSFFFVVSDGLICLWKFSDLNEMIDPDYGKYCIDFVIWLTYVGHSVRKVRIMKSIFGVILSSDDEMPKVFYNFSKIFESEFI